jgi:CoA:oxalate CoA-transferase
MKALEGVRVIDLTQAYSGPFCTMHLADHGAEVIKIERPGMGDQTRDWGPTKNDCSAYYAFLNRNKKSLELDLGSQEGKEILFKLVKDADVVCENFKVGTMDKLGVGYEELKKVNPKIIYASISGFGLTGPLSKLPAYDIVAQAMSGLMSITGFQESGPTKVGPSIGDNYSGAYLTIGILMALYHREKTGEGQRLDVAMMDTLYSVLENAIVKYTVGGFVPGQEGNADPSITPFDSFQAKDGLIVLGVGTNGLWAKLCKAMGREDLINNPLYENNIKRGDNYLPGLKNEIEAFTKTKTKAELEELMVGSGIPFGQILNVGEVSEHPQTKAREMLVEVDHPIIGKMRIQGVPIKLHNTPGSVDMPAPLLGQHNEEILKKLGYSKESISQLKDKGVI